MASDFPCASGALIAVLMVCLGVPVVAVSKPRVGGGSRSANADTTAAGDEAALSWQRIMVRPGDSISRIFARRGLSAHAWRTVMDLGPQTDGLRHLHPGDVIRIRKTPGGRLAGLRYQPEVGHRLRIYRFAGKLHVGVPQKPGELRRVLAAGEVRHSLAKSLAAAGVPPQVADQLSTIYRPRLNLSSAIRPGDRFSVIYSARYENRRYVGPGPVIAARVTVHGQHFDAFRALDADGKQAYYDRAGDAYRPAISRHPVNYTRISSRFSLHRMDPAVHIMRPHYGVDMAAPIGTPVHAAANGRVKYVGWAHGYGRLVEIRHTDGYSTRYAHLHHFARGLHDGERVERGQFIGTVGSTGESTGPHLLFEIRKNGVPHNPMTMALPAAPPLNGRRLALFKNRIQPLAKALSDPVIASPPRRSWVSSRSCADAAERNARPAVDKLFCLRQPPPATDASAVAASGNAAASTVD